MMLLKVPWIIANASFIIFLIISMFLEPTEWPREQDMDNETILFPIINTIWFTLILTEFYPVGHGSHPFPIEEEEHQLQEMY